jgi:hypothetical protein
VFGFNPSLRSSLEADLCSNFSRFLPDGDDFTLSPPNAEETGSGNWIIFKVSDSSQFPPELWVSNHCLILVRGDFTQPEFVFPQSPVEPIPVVHRPHPGPPHIFRIPPHFQDPTNDDWAAIPFERKNFWAKVREFIFGQHVVKATSFPISDLFGPTFWLVIVCIVIFLIRGIRIWVLRVFDK